MNNTLPNLNSLLADNSHSTQLKYDILTSKFMTGIHNYHKRNTLVSISNDIRLIGAVSKGMVVLTILVSTASCIFVPLSATSAPSIPKAGCRSITDYKEWVALFGKKVKTKKLPPTEMERQNELVTF